MSTYSIASSLLSSGVANIQTLITALQSDLPSKYTVGTYSSFSHTAGGTSAVDIHTVNITASEDELIRVISNINCSANNTSDNWQLRHNISGVTLDTLKRAKFIAPVSNTSGKYTQITLETVFENLSGAKTIELEVGSLDGAPAGNFYSHVGSTIVIQTKKR